MCFSVAQEEEEADEDEELGGLFRVSRPEKGRKQRMDALDCSRFTPDGVRDWDREEVGRAGDPRVGSQSTFDPWRCYCSFGSLWFLLSIFFWLSSFSASSVFSRFMHSLYK